MNGKGLFTQKFISQNISTHTLTHSHSLIYIHTSTLQLTSERDDSIPLEPADWDVLKDGYMKRSASILDWEEEGEGDASSLGDSPSSDSPNEEEYT